MIFCLFFPGAKESFARCFDAITHGLPYDYESITHFSAYQYARGSQPVIVPVNHSISMDILGEGNQGYPSGLDLLHINIVYCEGIVLNCFVHNYRMIYNTCVYIIALDHFLLACLIKHILRPKIYICTHPHKCLQCKVCISLNEKLPSFNFVKMFQAVWPYIVRLGYIFDMKKVF